MNYEQLELPLWSHLQSCRLAPESVDLVAVIDRAEVEISRLPQEVQMQAAGEAILQLAQLYSLRSHLLIDNWENAYRDPHIRSDLFADIVRQSMAVDLSDLMEPDPPRKRRAKSTTLKAHDSVAGLVDKSAVLAMVEQLEANASSSNSSLSDEELKSQALEVAYDEDISAWCDAIAQVMQHQGRKISLWQLQQMLNLSLVKVWLGLLHSPTPYQWENAGNFYREAQDIWICPI